MTRTIGVLALQGDVREHGLVLSHLGVHWREVRRPGDLEGIDGLILPGGESTTIGKLAVRLGMLEPIRERIEAGLPAYGTCAGMILCAAAVTRGDQPLLGVLDIVVERNAFGRQNESFEEDISVDGLREPFHAVFIRAPWVEKVGSQVEVLATVGSHPVMVRQGRVLGTAFHPELTPDDRIHRMFLELANGD